MFEEKSKYEFCLWVVYREICFLEVKWCFVYEKYNSIYIIRLIWDMDIWLKYKSFSNID